MLGASSANFASGFLTACSSRPHGLQQVTDTQQGRIDGQSVEAMAWKQLPFVPSPCKSVVPSQHSSILGVVFFELMPCTLEARTVSKRLTSAILTFSLFLVWDVSFSVQI